MKYFILKFYFHVFYENKNNHFTPPKTSAYKLNIRQST